MTISGGWRDWALASCSVHSSFQKTLLNFASLVSNHSKRFLYHIGCDLGSSLEITNQNARLVEIEHSGWWFQVATPDGIQYNVKSFGMAWNLRHKFKHCFWKQRQSRLLQSLDATREVYPMLFIEQRLRLGKTHPRTSPLYCAGFTIIMILYTGCVYRTPRARPAFGRSVLFLPLDIMGDC